MSTPAYPLTWPRTAGRTSPQQRKRARFGARGRGVTVAAAVDLLLDELGRLDVASCIISTNVKPTLAGRPGGSEAEPSDPGVADYSQQIHGVAVAQEQSA